VQRTRADAVLLLSDFAEGGGNPLYNAVDVNHLFAGMAPTAERPDLARTQLWFIDACRNFPAAFDNFERLHATDVFEVGLSDLDDRCAPVYFGSLPGASAYSIVDEETIFARALVECLEGAAGYRAPGSREWTVTVSSLLTGLQKVVAEIDEGSGQQVFDGGQTPRPDTPIVTLEGTPDVRVRIVLRPEANAGGVTLAVRRSDGTDVVVPAPLAPNPYVDRWKAGIYRLGAAPATCGIAEDDWPVLPPVFPWIGEITG
jgi:hypothetical protein